MLFSTIPIHLSTLISDKPRDKSLLLEVVKFLIIMVVNYNDSWFDLKIARKIKVTYMIMLLKWEF